MSAHKCDYRELVLADRFYVRSSVIKSGDTLELAPNSRVRVGSEKGPATTLGRLLKQRYVTLEKPIQVPCQPPLPPSTGPLGPLGMLDDYLRNWTETLSQKGPQRAVSEPVRQYIDDWLGYAEQRLTRDEPHPIATPEKFIAHIVAHFAETAPEFGGRFNVERFKKDLNTIVERTLRDVIASYAEYATPVFGQSIRGKDFRRLKRADELARIWLPEKSPVRKQLDRIFRSIGDREMIGP